MSEQPEGPGISGLFAVFLIFLFLLFISAPVNASDEITNWLKGNLHCHSDRSVDADTPVEDVIGWYFDHNYDFVAVTDHDIEPLYNGIIENEGRKILVIPAVEISAAGHISGINIEKYDLGDQTIAFRHLSAGDFAPPGTKEQGKMLYEVNAWIEKEQTAFEQLNAQNIDFILENGGLPVFNHPYRITAKQVMQASEKLKHIEIWNGTIEGERMKILTRRMKDIDVNYMDPSNLEKMWDDILSTGRVMYGMAVDDAHHFQEVLNPEAAHAGKKISNPGRGWVMVRSDELNTGAILAALNSGNFYATTGPALSSIRYKPGESLSVEVVGGEDTQFKIYFIGEGGRILKTAIGKEAMYEIRQSDLYVRVKVYGFFARFAWTQPVFPGLPDQPYVFGE